MPSAATLLLSPVRNVNVRVARATARTVALRALTRPDAPKGPTLEHAVEASNIVAVPEGMDAALSEGQRRKLELQAQAAAALEAENSWWCDAADTPINLLTADSPADYKRLITSARPTQLVVVDYLKPSCAACRRLYPKLLQIAKSNPDALFIKVNVETPEMRELGRGMNVTHLPWFHMFRGGDLIASFSANVTTVSTLRAEIAANKACVDPGCSVY